MAQREYNLPNFSFGVDAMKYISTRGNGELMTFQQAVLEGLSRDGGLLLPQHVPNFSDKLNNLKGLSYQELALEIFISFIAGEISKEVVKKLIKKSYQDFSCSEITPLRFTKNITLLELFHGPTLAFKDIALQFLGNLFEEIVSTKRTSLNILGATSGDTGSSAIFSLRGKKNITIFMLHPKGKISPIQEKQMTTVLDDNVVNIAIEGTFDDTQSIVKEIFNDLEFKDKYHLGAVNSINWVRIMAQVVYYFYAVFRFREKYPNLPIVFSVPTGNFGDIYAGYMALKMGLPIKKLILATNDNDILYRTLETGLYKIKEVSATLSPSMDIQVSSNFERLLFDIVGENGNIVNNKMEELALRKEFKLSADQLSKAQEVFLAIRIDTEQTLATIKKYQRVGITLDPHTAVGVAAAEKSSFSNVICLATAHPAKFQQTVEQAIGESPEIPPSLIGISGKKSKCLISINDHRAVKQIIVNKLVSNKK